MFLLRAVLNILVRYASPRGPMCFRCLIFNLSGPCEFFIRNQQNYIMNSRSERHKERNTVIVCQKKKKKGRKGR